MTRTDAGSHDDAPRIPAERLLAVHTAAERFFVRNLHAPGGTDAYLYLTRRGFTDALHESPWSVGYAPPRWTGLVDHLRRTGFDDREIVVSGLGVDTRRHTVVDRFRERVMFGIRNDDGDVVAFIGRAAPREVDVPRYLNSPASVLYDKSATLFGLAEQRRQLAAGAVPVLVEGPLDAIAVSLASTSSGPVAGLAPCGTSLTTAQVQALARHHRGTVLVAFDSDPAGVRATARSYSPLSREFSTACAVYLPADMDPAGLLQARGVVGLRDALSRTTTLADRIVDDVIAAYADRLDNADARVCALREIAAAITTFRPNDVARQAARVSSLLRLEQTTVTRELIDAVGRRQLPSTTGATATSSTVQDRTDATTSSTRMYRHVSPVGRRR